MPLAPPPPTRARPLASWRDCLATLREPGTPSPIASPASPSPTDPAPHPQDPTQGWRIWYELGEGPEESLGVALWVQEQLGALGPLDPARHRLHRCAPEDRMLVALLCPSLREGNRRPRRGGRLPPRTSLEASLAWAVLPQLCATGRCIRTRGGEPLHWDDGGPWRAAMHLQPGGDGDWRLRVGLERPPQTVWLDVEGRRLLPGALAVMDGKLVRCSTAMPAIWRQALTRLTRITIPAEDLLPCLAELLELSEAPPLRLPPEVEARALRVQPRPWLVLRRPTGYPNPAIVTGEMLLEYDGHRVQGTTPRRDLHVARQAGVLIRRDGPREQAALTELHSLIGTSSGLESGGLVLRVADLPQILGTLLDRGWGVTHTGREVLQAGPPLVRLGLAEGGDLLLCAQVRFGEHRVGLATLLGALAREQVLLQLGSEHLGLLPRAWLVRYAHLVPLGELEEEALRCPRSLSRLLEPILQREAHLECDPRLGLGSASR